MAKLENSGKRVQFVEGGVISGLRLGQGNNGGVRSPHISLCWIWKKR